MSANFVAVIAGINRSQNQTEILLSDGYYTMRSIIKTNGERGSNEGKIIEMIGEGKLYSGIKVHMINQTMV
jgi:hypothetical protein